VDSLLQTFENCRAGLSDETLASGEKGVRAFFVDLYEKEIERLRETVRVYEAGYSDATQQEMFEKVDELVRKVVVPAYARLATRATRRERNDFYLVPEPFHGLERIAWGSGGMALGAFAVWAPFIPIWEKEWILPFVLVGLLFPNIRRYLAVRRYESDLNRVVARADDEIWRMDLAYLTSEGSHEKAIGARRVAPADSAPSGSARPRESTKQGGR
jgi:hypothetical protein